MIAATARRCLMAVLPLLIPAAPMAQTVEEKARACSVCHGETGIPVEKNTPIIWGQAGGYMYLQMYAYQRGTRSDPQMANIVRDMDRLEMVALAEHFAQKFWPRFRQPIPPEEIAQRGKQLDEAGECTTCHEDGTHRPRIAGQTYEYLVKTLNDYRTFKRMKWPKNELLSPLQDTDIEALAQYLAAM
jgi:cytochrome c553